jgi:hypothetical protein
VFVIDVITREAFLPHLSRRPDGRGPELAPATRQISPFPVIAPPKRARYGGLQGGCKRI